METISPKICLDIEKSRFRFRDFCHFLEGFGIGFGDFGLGKKSWFRFRRKLVSDKKYRFRKIWCQKKSFCFGKFGIRKKVSVSVSVKILVSSFSGFTRIYLFRLFGYSQSKVFSLRTP